MFLSNFVHDVADRECFDQTSTAHLFSLKPVSNTDTSTGHRPSRKLRLTHLFLVYLATPTHCRRRIPNGSCLPWYANWSLECKKALQANTFWFSCGARRVRLSASMFVARLPSSQKLMSPRRLRKYCVNPSPVLYFVFEFSGGNVGSSNILATSYGQATLHASRQVSSRTCLPFLRTTS